MSKRPWVTPNAAKVLQKMREARVNLDEPVQLGPRKSICYDLNDQSIGDPHHPDHSYVTNVRIIRNGKYLDGGAESFPGALQIAQNLLKESN